VINEILLYIGSGLLIIWGIVHLIPAAKVDSSFGSVPEVRRKLIKMEVIAGGLFLCFIGVLVALITIFVGAKGEAPFIVYVACAAMLFVLAVLNMFTIARGSLLAHRIYPAVNIVAAILFILGGTI
jgi:hypothetical protein